MHFKVIFLFSLAHHTETLEMASKKTRQEATITEVVCFAVVIGNRSCGCGLWGCEPKLKLELELELEICGVMGEKTLITFALMTRCI